MGHADTIAKLVAGPMRALSLITYPAVWLLSVSTSAIVRIFKLGDNTSKVTEDEIKSLIREGTDSGEVREVEQDIMERALVMGDSRIGAIMTSRKDVAALTVDMDEDSIRQVLFDRLHSSYPVYDKDKEDICGVISLKSLVLSLGKPDFNIEKTITQGMCLPETMTVYDALETFRTSDNHTALVYDEFGCFAGIITLRDILDGLVGNITQPGEGPMIVKRPDVDEWLVDCQCQIYDFLAYFHCEELYKPAGYTTIGGLIM